MNNITFASKEIILNFTQSKTCFLPSEINEFIINTIQGEYLIMISGMLVCSFILSIGITKNDKFYMWMSFSLMMILALVYWVLYLVRL